jgi:hypothetical protein
MFSHLTQGMEKSRSAANEELDDFMNERLSERIKKRLREKSQLAKATKTVFYVERPYRDSEPPDVMSYAAMRSANVREHREHEEAMRTERNRPGGDVARLKRKAQMEAMKSQMLGSDAEREKHDLQEQTLKLFKAFDTDGSGDISREEMVNGAPLLGMDAGEAMRLFDKLDVDGNGVVDLEEFRKKNS